MKLDKRRVRRSYEDQFYRMQGPRRHPIQGILIYEQARRKLNISPNGYLYRQRWFSYIPIIGPSLSMIYAHYCLGKVKSLRTKDEILFRNCRKMVQLFGYFIWPIIFLSIWTLLSYLIADFSINNENVLLYNLYQYGRVGAYAANWNNIFLSPVVNASDFWIGLSNFFGGLFSIFVFPLLPGPQFGVVNASIGCNIIFILSIVVLTVMNPINLFCTFLINRPILRFTIVYESSSIYRYRSSH